MAEVT